MTSPLGFFFLTWWSALGAGAAAASIPIIIHLLNRRRYVVSTGSDVPGERYLITVSERLSFTVSGAGNQSSLFPESWPGAVCPRIPCKVERLTA